MRMDAAALPVLLIVFAATLIRSALGFGEALFAVPLLAFFLPLQVAAPLAVLLSVTIAAIVVAQDRRQADLRSAGWLVLATIPGVPIGVLLLKIGHAAVLKGALGAMILAYSLWSLTRRTPAETRGDSRIWLAACGFSAGVLGGAFGMNGPPLVLYGAMRRWPAQRFRATLQAYFLPASLLGMCGFWLAGLWTGAVTRDYLLSLPAMVPAVFLGRAINRRLHSNVFLQCAWAALCCIGAALIAEVLLGRA
jgi:uncharacterized protein